MIKTVLIRTIATAALTLLAACEPYPMPEQAIPFGPTADELADYATAQMRYRAALATGNADAVAISSETFRQIPREIFSRQDPKLFDAELVCERYQVADRSTPPNFEPQCQSVGWRYNEATTAIRRDLDARVAAANSATIAQASAAHP
jgi:hypothetical protein